MQHKMTNTMTMQEQIELSGLEIMSSLSSSSSSSQLQWNSTNQWSPLLGGRRECQACVTIESGNENDTGGQAIVVIGGVMQGGEYITNSVIVWDPSTKRWRNGPSLNDRRRDLVAVVCHDKVYACWMIWIIINLNRVPARIKRLRRPLNEIFGIKQVRQISTSESEINSLFYYYLSIFYILE